jgi:HSP90 family molecular chaperone
MLGRAWKRLAGTGLASGRLRELVSEHSKFLLVPIGMSVYQKVAKESIISKAHFCFKVMCVCSIA